MRNRTCLFICIALCAIYACSTNAFAYRVVLNPERVETIQSPKESRDVRILLYFEIPNGLASRNVIIEFAKLVFTAKVTEAKTGLIGVYPVTRSWKGKGSVTWSDNWESEGGDFSLENAGKPVTVKSAKGLTALRCDVTYIVLAWLDGFASNYGFIIVPSWADLINSDVKYFIDTNDIKLVINYDKD